MKAEAAMAITPSLLIRAIKYSGTTTGSLIKLSVAVASELYLGTISLAKGGPAEATTGKFSQGSTKSPGFADATISAELFDSILADAKVAKLAIELDYDPKQGLIRNVFIEYV